MPKKPAWQMVVDRLGAADEKTARSLIMSGKVFCNGEPLSKPGQLIVADAALDMAQATPFVSRAGEKLAFAIRRFSLDLQDKVVLDIGASTGGFVDCALQHGASLVYAVDVGTNQLVYALRSDRRVVAMEKTNLKTLEKNMFMPAPDLVTCDVSFISLSHVFRVLAGWSNTVMALVKPQFEATKTQMQGTGGLCPPELHQAIIAKVQKVAQGYGFELVDIASSPVAGKVKGNLEYVSLWRKVQHG